MGCELMNPDMCADQFFLYDENHRIKYLVDFDACVKGPVEWDLAFWKKFVPDWKISRKVTNSLEKCLILMNGAGILKL